MRRTSYTKPDRRGGGNKSKTVFKLDMSLKSPLREKFHLLEDELISIDNLFRKLQNWLNPEEKSSLIFL